MIIIEEAVGLIEIEFRSVFKDAILFGDIEISAEGYPEFTFFFNFSRLLLVFNFGFIGQKVAQSLNLLHDYL